MNRNGSATAPLQPLDVSHPCWTGVENDFDHDWNIESWEQGDPSTPYYESGVSRVCACCFEVDEDWHGDSFYEDDWR